MSTTLSDAPLPVRRVVHGLKVVEGRNWSHTCFLSGEVAPIGQMFKIWPDVELFASARAVEAKTPLDPRRVIRLQDGARLLATAPVFEPQPLPSTRYVDGKMLARASLDALAKDWWAANAAVLTHGHSSGEFCFGFVLFFPVFLLFSGFKFET
jgi:hypothetical protein